MVYYVKTHISYGFKIGCADAFIVIKTD